MPTSILHDIIIIFGLSTIVLLICHRLRVPAIVGYLLTGLLAGPHGFGLVKGVETVRMLAEIGIILLLFTIGLEFSFRKLFQLKRIALLGGTLQVILTVLFVFFPMKLVGHAYAESIFMGFLMSLSSTAIVMKILQDRGEVETPAGSTALGILIFQDIVVIPMIILSPLLAGSGNAEAGSLTLTVVAEIGVILSVLLSSKRVVPWFFYRVAETKNRELFLITVIIICLAVAWLTHIVGGSLALGAFLAGLVISESEYSYQALGNVQPFRDVFTSFFFVSVGMLLDMGYFFRQPFGLISIAAAVLFAKGVIAGLSVLLVGLPLRTAAFSGLFLAQVGEFSFVLSETGSKYGLLDAPSYQGFLGVSILTMMATPFIIARSTAIVPLILKLPLPRRMKRGSYPLIRQPRPHVKDHLIIIGFGLNGKNLARAAKSSGIPYVVVEINPATVREERSRGEAIYYGDATQESVLDHVNIRHAKAVAVVINDPVATRRITEVARRLNPKVYIVCRTRFLRELEPLRALGADEVIPEEFETSIEIFSRVLGKYLLPKDEIEKFISEVRADGYQMFRSMSREATACFDLRLCLPDVDISTFRISEGSPAVGKTLAETEMRKRYGVTLLAIRRDSDIISNPDPSIRFHKDDILFVVGSREKIAEVSSLFTGAKKNKT